MPTEESILRIQFFEYVFEDESGYVCLALGTPRKSQKDGFYQEFFKWPEQKQQITEFIEGARTKNVWFGINLLEKPERIKENCQPTKIVWADLDACHPDTIEPRPSVVIESSPNRFQALWKLSESVASTVAEEYSKRIYNRYRDAGVDSGWALTKLLRVPFTLNHKYHNAPDVVLTKVAHEGLDPSVFENIIIEDLSEAGIEDIEMPDLTELPAAEFVIYEYRHPLKETSFKNLYFSEPDENWSASLWQLIRICFEVGMTREEVLVIAASSKCNKYERDKRPLRHLWLDIVKANTIDTAFAVITGELDATLEFPTLVEEDVNIENSFLHEYVTWASSVTDANKEYHELCGAMLLSILLADKLHLNVSFGKIIPNLWGLILGESTLTRKTTAMEMVMEFVSEIDPTVIIATTDSSAEGLLTALSARPSLVSVYYRDEVAGFFDAMANKSYLAGLPETLTKLYDVPPVHVRQLRKETITITKPVFVFFGGGIRDRVYEAVNEDFFFSGFLPRFLVVSGEADIDAVRWMGPASDNNNSSTGKESIRSTLADMVSMYRTQIISTKLLGQEATISKDVEAVLTTEAWQKMQEIESLLVMTANANARSMIALPTFTRLSVSILKLSILIAASRQEPRDFQITVELRDIIASASLVQKWATHTVHMMTNVGTTTSERLIQKILRSIRDHPGMTRAECMRRHHLQSIPAKSIFATLEERGLVQIKQSGRGWRLYPI
jgi:ribosomal protein S25